MLYFENDYSEGAHEKVLKHLIDTNMEQLSGYGHDTYCERAKQKIKEANVRMRRFFSSVEERRQTRLSLMRCCKGMRVSLQLRQGMSADMRQEQLNLPVIRYSRFHRRMERYRQKN